MKKTFYINIQLILFVVMGILTAALLAELWITPNIETEQSREVTGYKIIKEISYREAYDFSAPVGITREFRFKLDDDIARDTTLVFQFSHQNAEVYIDDEKVYSLKVSDELSVIKTPGDNWASIPVYREDMGKEVIVKLIPVYENYLHQNIQFLIGSKLAIYTAQFVKSIPEIVLSLTDILIGVILFCAAVYFSVKKVKNSRFYALAVLAISLGLWNFTQTDFAPLIMSSKTVFIYYISLTMLMICIIPLIKSVNTPEKKLNGKILQIWCAVCGGVCILQLVIQFSGLLDLREMLKITHGMIAVSSIVLIGSSFSELIGNRKNDVGRKKIGCIWFLGAGALADMLIYYIKGSSSGLLFVLIGIFCYVLIEAIQIFFSYADQKQLLEEKETQLTLSRITAMMSQIRSHFVFNILNAISGMCKYDPEKADETVVRFARYLRNNIDIVEDDKPVLFSTELVHIEDYVILEQIRFGDKIEFYADVEVDQFMIPPLIIQPVVENAIKHGVTKKQEGGTVVLRTWEDEENIKISVEDDGVGFELSELEKEKSVGLKNIRYRLHHLVNGTLNIKSQTGSGTVVTISIPKKEVKLCE